MVQHKDQLNYGDLHGALLHTFIVKIAEVVVN